MWAVVRLCPCEDVATLIFLGLHSPFANGHWRLGHLCSAHSLVCASPSGTSHLPMGLGRGARWDGEGVVVPKGRGVSPHWQGAVPERMEMVLNKGVCGYYQTGLFFGKGWLRMIFM